MQGASYTVLVNTPLAKEYHSHSAYQRLLELYREELVSMYTTQPKKLLIINILDILKKYTDQDHRLSQQEIVKILEREYCMTAGRKAVRRNLSILMEFGFDIEYSESIRKKKDGEEEVVLTDWYLNREISDSELRLLIDSLLFSKHIPYSQCQALVKKLEGLSSTYFQSRVKHISTLPNERPNNNQIFYTIEILDEAISKGRQVSFRYNEIGMDRKGHPRRNKEGQIREYIINPYQMVAANGRYYLICNYDKYDNVSNYRVERITDIQLLKTQRKPAKKVTGLENGFDLPKHMAEHIYMFAGEGVRVRFFAQKKILNDLMDWFDADAKFIEKDDDTLEVAVTVNEDAMFHWAMQYGPYVEVIEPLTLRDRLKVAFQDAAAKYSTR